jgi:hypothetical protein
MTTGISRVGVRVRERHQLRFDTRKIGLGFTVCDLNEIERS